MIEIMPESQGSILGIKLSGRFTGRDYRERLLPRLESFLLAQGRARLLFYLADNLEDLDLMGILRDVRLGGRPQEQIERLAVVGASENLEWALRLGAALLQSKMKSFPRRKLKEAWRWLGS